MSYGGGYKPCCSQGSGMTGFFLWSYRPPSPSSPSLPDAGVCDSPPPLLPRRPTSVRCNCVRCPSTPRERLPTTTRAIDSVTGHTVAVEDATPAAEERLLEDTRCKIPAVESGEAKPPPPSSSLLPPPPRAGEDSLLVVPFPVVPPLPLSPLSYVLPLPLSHPHGLASSRGVQGEATGANGRGWLHLCPSVVLKR